ncbi:MAG: peptidoglycan DD-metalloendopeptidase family protein [Chloroflexota bacterium]
MANTSTVPRWAKYAGAGALALSLTAAAWAHGRFIVNGAPSTEPATAVVEAQAPTGDAAAAALTAAAQMPPAAPAIVDYTVQNGDTLWDIAIKHNTDVASIMALNDLTRSSSLKIGQTLKILTIKGTVHKVKSGDTLSGIASSYGVGTEVIAQANGISNQHAIAIGQQLIIPGGKPQLVASSDTSRGSSSRPSSTKTSSSSNSSGSSSSSGVFAWPVRGTITSGFGSRWGSIHTGIDIAVPSGTPVKAAKGGTVIEARWMNGYGYAVEIDHGGGVVTLYGHNSKLLVSVGDRVETGDVIARSGSTGRSTGPHVHFEVRKNGKAVNPRTNGLK